MKIFHLLTNILDISLIFISGSLVVDGQFFSFGDKKVQTRKKEGTFRIRSSISTNMAVKSQTVSFLLFTRKNRILPEVVTAERSRLSKYFSHDKETKIIIHSFMQAATDKIYLQIKDAYLNSKDLNVILADWPHARVFTYSIAATVTEHVGLEIVRLIKALRPELLRVHIIGFGLGAHSGGIAGAELYSQVGRITGLDPSMPLFRMLDDYFKLDEDDGKFVDIIHTDAGDNFWFANHLGLGKPSGSVDFYPNKGIFQPGCLNASILNYDDMYCSHVRSLELFAESIENPNSLMACKCNNWVSFMGAKCDCTNENNLIAVGEGSGTNVRNVKGRYYLVTNERKPYGMGKIGSRSPRENSLHDIMESLDQLTKIVVNKEGNNKPVNLGSLADRLFTKDEMTILSNLNLLENITNTDNEENIALEENDEDKANDESDKVVKENENYENYEILSDGVLKISTTPDPLQQNYEILEDGVLKISTTPAPLQITENHELVIDDENESDYEILEENVSDHEHNEDGEQNKGHEEVEHNEGHEENEEVGRNEGHEQNEEVGRNEGHEQNEEVERNEGHEQNEGHEEGEGNEGLPDDHQAEKVDNINLAESSSDKDERNNKLHLLYIIGTLKSGQNIDGLKEYRILK